MSPVHLLILFSHEPQDRTALPALKDFDFVHEEHLSVSEQKENSFLSDSALFCLMKSFSNIPFDVTEGQASCLSFLEA